MLSDKVLAQLTARQGEFISGQALADALGVSRSAVWKAVGQLTARGFGVEAVTNRGYRLTHTPDVISAERITACLKNRALRVVYLPSVTSTNAVLREMAEQDAPAGTLVVASHQTAGRGRRGRSFLSPAGTGVYFSLLLRPRGAAEQATRLTAYAAVAAAEAVEAVSGRCAGIKWVNDVLLDGKKVCGILTEGAAELEGGSLRWAVLGVGINLCPPEGGFPDELAPIAGTLFDAQPDAGTVCRLVALFADRFTALARSDDAAGALKAYRSRCVTVGRPVTVLSPAGDYDALAEAVDDDFRLIVRTTDGQRAALSSGEVSVRPSKT